METIHFGEGSRRQIAWNRLKSLAMRHNLINCSCDSQRMTFEWLRPFTGSWVFDICSLLIDFPLIFLIRILSHFKELLGALICRSLEAGSRRAVGLVWGQFYWKFPPANCFWPKKFIWNEAFPSKRRHLLGGSNVVSANYLKTLAL